MSYKKLSPLDLTTKSKRMEKINQQITTHFGEEPSLAHDLISYVKKLKEDKLDDFESVLDWIDRYRAGEKQAREKHTASLQKMFFKFLHSYGMKDSKRLPVETDRDPEIMRIATAFYKKHKNQFNGEFKDEEGLNPDFTLEVMVAHDHELMEMFCKLGYDYNLRQSSMGNTPLLSLISNSYNAEASYLLDLADKYPEKKLDVNIRSSVFGTNALHLAVAKGYRQRNKYDEEITLSNLALTQKILEHGADVNLGMETKDPKTHGMTALHLAAARKDMEFCKWLIEQGAQIDLKNAVGQTPIDLLFLSDEEAHSLISACTGGQSIFRKFQPADPSPQALKTELEQAAKTYVKASSSKRLKEDKDLLSSKYPK